MRFLTISLLLSFVIACSSQTSNNNDAEVIEAENPDIKIQIEGAPAGPAYLIGVFTDQRYKVDSTTVDAEGNMHFQRDTPYEPGLLFVLLSDNSFFQIMVDKDQTFEMHANAGAIPQTMQVEGSLDNELLYKNMRFENDFQPKLQKVSQELKTMVLNSPGYVAKKKEQDALLAERKAHLEEIFKAHPNTFFTKFKSAGQNPDIKDVRRADGSLDTSGQVYLYRTEFWDNVDFGDERLLRTPVISNKLSRYITELTPQHPDSINEAASYLVDQVLENPEYYKFFANWITLKYEPTKTSLMDPEAVYVHMVQNYFTYDRAFWSDSSQVYALQLRAHEMAGSLIGNKGPDVTAPGPDGKKHTLSDIKAPYIVVYLYNPTCEHCMEETPRLVQFYKQWKDKGVEVFAIAVDTEVDEWKEYLRKNNMNWINVFDPTNQSIYAKYYVDNTPEIYVLNPDRTIIAKNLKVHQIEEVIERDKE